MAKIPVALIIQAARCYKRNSGTPTLQLVLMTLGPSTGFGKLSTTLFETEMKRNEVDTIV